MVTHVREGCLLGSATPLIGRVPASFLKPSTCTRHDSITVTKFCKVIKLDERKNFTGSTSPSALARDFCDTDAELQLVHVS